MYDRRGDLPFDQRTADDLPNRRMILLDGRAARAFRSGRKPANGHRALRDGVHFPIGTQQWGLQQHPSLQCVRVSHRRNSHIEPFSGFNKGRNVGGDHHHGHVFRLNGGRPEY